MAVSLQYRRTARILHDRDRHDAEIDYEEGSDRQRQEAYQMMWPFRFCIELRTTRERMDAESTVTDRFAQFLSGPCARETCKECTRPMWQHIAIFNGGTLCPFGREYWALARALMYSLEGTERPHEVPAIRAIASRQD
jgi:hypothetical protein